MRGDDMGNSGNHKRNHSLKLFQGQNFYDQIAIEKKKLIAQRTRQNKLLSASRQLAFLFIGRSTISLCCY